MCRLGTGPDCTVQFGPVPILHGAIWACPQPAHRPVLHLAFGAEALDNAAAHPGETFNLAGGETFRF